MFGKFGDNFCFVWEFEFEEGGFIGVFLIVDGVIYVVDMDGVVLVIKFENMN